MEQNIQLQFLQLEEVENTEAEYLNSLLNNSGRSSSTNSLPKLELPWVEPEEIQQQWNEQQQYDGEGEVYDGGGGGEVYQMPVPVATTIPQMYHHPQVIPQLPNLTYVSNIHQTPNMGYGIHPPMAPYHPPPPHPQVFPEGRRPRAAKPSPKRTREAANYQTVTGPPPPQPYPHQFPVPMPYQYIPQPAHIPTAQHATGPPLYMAPAIPIYHTAYNYPTVFSPMQQQQQQQPQVPQEDLKPLALEFEKEAALPQPPQPVAANYEKPVVEANKTNAANVIEETPPPDNTPPKEEKKVKSAPYNAIIKTSLPSLPPTKRRGYEDATPEPPPVAPAPPPVQSPSSTTKSWAQILVSNTPKGPDAPLILENSPLPTNHPPPTHHHNPTPVPHTSSNKVNQFKPSINAVVSAPPRYDKPQTHQQSSYQHQDHAINQEKQEEVNPQLRSIGEVLSHYQLDHKSIILTPRGLKNPSNYCYINATLQALLACPAFYNLIKVISEVKTAAVKCPALTDRQVSTKSKTPIIDSMIQFIKEFSPAQVSRGKREKEKARKEKDENPVEMPPVGAPFEPTYVYKMLRALRSEDSFHEEGRQEDAEEFLSLLLNGLNDEMLELQKLVQDPKSQPIVNGDLTANGDAHNEDDSIWKEVTTKGNRVTRRAELERTPLSDIFRGQLRSSVHRTEESLSTDNVQPFFTLQLDIESSETVSEALEKLTGWDQVEGASPSQASNVWQTQSLDQLPCVLILHLKCFHYRQQTPSKIVKALQFPVDLKLDPKLLSTKNKGNVKGRQYKLFAVVYHDGKEATKGHYLTDVFHLGGPGWIRFDDALVHPVQENQVLHPKSPRVPYLLYYRRADTIGPQSSLVSKNLS